MLSLIFRKNHTQKEITPSVTCIIAAFNEERVIKEKIQNDLKMDYPKDKLEIIIVSDGSNDQTEKIVKNYETAGIVGLHRSERLGKTAALNRAVAYAHNEIIIFSDANSMFRADAIKKLVGHFADPSIGGVCGRKSILKNEKRKASLGDTLFWLYESALKTAESKLGSIPTADGEIFALRKELFVSIDPRLINDDMVMTLDILRKGKRIIYEPDAITEEEASISLKDDFNVKSRMVYGGLQIISLYKKELNPFTSLFAIQFFIHKTLRYFMWILLLLIYISNLTLFGKNLFYNTFFVLQTMFYLFAMLGNFQDKRGKNFVFFYLPYYYCNVNLAAFKGFIFFIKQRSNVEVWKKATR